MPMRCIICKSPERLGKIVHLKHCPDWHQPNHTTIENLKIPSITCPVCVRTSYNPNDIKEGYCGACHDYTTKL
jgi:hypothetical protein